MRPLRYSINVTLDGCCDHREGSTDEELHRYWAEKLAQADALLFGRVTYEMMEAAWRPSATGARPDWMTDWMEPFARTIDAAKKYVVSSTLKGAPEGQFAGPAWRSPLYRRQTGSCPALPAQAETRVFAKPSLPLPLPHNPRSLRPQPR